MEFLDGENLSIYTRTDAKLPIHKIFQVGKEILSALIAMQSKENLFCTETLNHRTLFGTKENVLC